MTYVHDRTLQLDDGRAVGPFSSHWAAVAAMIRAGDPSFKSLGGDRQSDLDLEASIPQQAG
jgi:hypothetical protein